jgi:hypothetical protein
MNKKGDLTSTELITLVIVVLSMIILLIFLWLWFYGFSEQKDICKLSVLTRATTPDMVAQGLPLKCKSTKICLTNDGGSKCDEQLAGEEGVEVIVLRGSPAEKRTQIEEVSANAMYDCWDMMGQGKLDLFGTTKSVFGLEQVKSSCVICSRVAIDKSVIYKDYKAQLPDEPKVYNDILYQADSKGNVLLYQSDGPGSYAHDGAGNLISVPNIDSSGKLITPPPQGAVPYSLVDINRYMSSHQVPGQSMTYLQAFTDRGVGSFATVGASEQTKIAEADVKEKYPDKSVTSFARSTTYPQMAFVFMQIKTVSKAEVVKNMLEAGGTIAGAAFMTPVIGKGFRWAAKVTITTLKGWVVVPVLVVGGAVLGYGMWNAQQGQLAAANYCGPFTSSEKASEGCSVVQGIDFNVQLINELCGGQIEGEP